MAHSQNNHQDEPTNGGPVCNLHAATPGAWPVVDAMSYEPEVSDSSTITQHVTAQQALENVISRDGGPVEPPRRRASRLRRFTNGFPLLRRQATGETSASTANTLEVSSPMVASLPAPHDETEDDKESNDAALEAWVLKKSSE